MEKGKRMSVYGGVFRLTKKGDVVGDKSLLSTAKIVAILNSTGKSRNTRIKSLFEHLNRPL